MVSATSSGCVAAWESGEDGIVSSLTGKVVLVTGGGSGIGRASAAIMASRGAKIVVSDLDVGAARAVVREITQHGGTAIALACDIGDEGSISDAVAATVHQFGRLDVMHNNAALTSVEVSAKDTDILAIPTEIWDQMMAVTLRGSMLGCRYAVRSMLETGGGAIVNTSSTFGLSAHNQNVAYGVAKAGVNMLTEYVATAFGRHNIRCNAVAPALIATPAADAFVPAALKAVHEASFLTPYVGRPEDVAHAVAFLASDEARFITGQVVRVDGGTLSHLPTYADARRFYASVASG
jgi:NAD(P)-dependent dehydrogenase (short-subunit alcohol dehydrogenase family)